MSTISGSSLQADNPDAADRLVSRISKATARLMDYPESGSLKIEPDIRSIPVGSYTIYYRVADQVVEIVRVLHAARDAGAVDFGEPA